VDGFEVSSELGRVAITQSHTRRRGNRIEAKVNREMWKRAVVGAVGALRRPFSSEGGGISSAVNSMLLRSLKDHYLEVSKMNMPPVRSLSLCLLGFYFRV